MIQIPNKPYKILGPNETFEGRTYADLQEEFWKWIFTLDCDRTNIGDVVFLRGVAFPDDPENDYTGNPVIMLGDNRLVISEDQAIFFCCYTTMAESIDQAIPDSSTGRRNDVVLALNSAGIPHKEQICIDREKIITPNDIPLSEFRVVTNEFMLTVPDPSTGRALGPYFETVLSPGDHPSVAGGYCFLVQFEEGTHYIHTIGKGVPYQGGEYITESVYEIKVIKSNRTEVPLSMLRSFTQDRVKNRIIALNKANKVGGSTSQDELLSQLIDQSKWEKK